VNTNDVEERANPNEEEQLTESDVLDFLNRAKTEGQTNVRTEKILIVLPQKRQFP
jgi:hypothetical protein